MLKKIFEHHDIGLKVQKALDCKLNPQRLLKHVDGTTELQCESIFHFPEGDSKFLRESIQHIIHRE